MRVVLSAALSPRGHERLDVSNGRSRRSKNGGATD